MKVFLVPLNKDAEWNFSHLQPVRMIVIALTTV